MNSVIRFTRSALFPNLLIESTLTYTSIRWWTRKRNRFSAHKMLGRVRQSVIRSSRRPKYSNAFKWVSNSGSNEYIFLALTSAVRLAMECRFQWAVTERWLWLTVTDYTWKWEIDWNAIKLLPKLIQQFRSDSSDSKRFSCLQRQENHNFFAQSMNGERSWEKCENGVNRITWLLLE